MNHMFCLASLQSIILKTHDWEGSSLHNPLRHAGPLRNARAFAKLTMEHSANLYAWLDVNGDVGFTWC